MDNPTKIFAALFFSSFLYAKILNCRNIAAAKIVFLILVFGVIAYSPLSGPTSSPGIQLMLLIPTSGCIIAALSKTRIDLAITVMTLSFAIHYVLLLIAGFPAAFLLRIFFPYVHATAFLLLALFFEAVIIWLLFHVRRLKNGFTFLQQKEAGGIGLVISGIAIVTVFMIGYSEISTPISILFGVCAIVCAIGIYLWWRSGLTKSYMERLATRNIQGLQEIIDDKDAEIQMLTANNDFLTTLIHRDNKLMPAMYTAVRMYLQDTWQLSAGEQKALAETLLIDLDVLIQERIGVLDQFQKENKSIPKTGISLIDATVVHLLHLAAAQSVEFNVAVTGNVRTVLRDSISESSLQTLIADLGENAIIAASDSVHRRVLFRIIATDDCCELTFSDSGAPFAPEVLERLGQRRVTTHANEGGSGIGYMATFQILRDTSASLRIIAEHSPTPSSFTKTIAVCFDGKCEFLVSGDDSMHPCGERYNDESELPWGGME